MSNVSDVLTHKAIRNISSYRQKVGRAGRESGTDAPRNDIDVTTQARVSILSLNDSID